MQFTHKGTIADQRQKNLPDDNYKEDPRQKNIVYIVFLMIYHSWKKAFIFMMETIGFCKNSMIYEAEDTYNSTIGLSWNIFYIINIGLSDCPYI